MNEKEKRREEYEKEQEKRRKEYETNFHAELNGKDLEATKTIIMMLIARTLDLESKLEIIINYMQDLANRIEEQNEIMLKERGN